MADARIGQHVCTNRVQLALVVKIDRLARMHEEDREEVIDLSEQIETAIAATDETALKSAAKELRELLFFVEGKR